MPNGFLHGVEHIELNGGPRPIKSIRLSVIGLIGTAPNADAEKFPLNTPVLVAGRRTEAAPLGADGTLPAAIDDIFDQAGAAVVVIRVEEGADEAETMANVIGGVDPDTHQRIGAQAFLDAESAVGVTPRILIAPEFSHNLAVTTEMVTIADRLRGIIIFDGPNSNDADAIAYRDNFGSRRLYGPVDPWVKVFDTGSAQEVIRPSSARIAGVAVRNDNENGVHTSFSNKLINGIVGTARPIDFQLGDRNSRANILNENEVPTIVRKEGFLVWGNRTCSNDPKWAFISHVRTADLVAESILRAHMWAVDRNITKTYVDDVLFGINSYIDYLKSIDVISGGKAWLDPEINSSSQIIGGNVFFDYDLGFYGVAERVTFRQQINNNYLTEVLPIAA